MLLVGIQPDGNDVRLLASMRDVSLTPIPLSSTTEVHPIFDLLDDPSAEVEIANFLG